MTYTWVNVATARVVSTSPAHVASIVVTPKETKKGYVILYDGQSTGDPKILTVRCNTGVTQVINFQPPLVTHRGLYVDTLHDIDDLIIQLAWEHE